MIAIFSNGSEEYPTINPNKQESFFLMKGRSISHNSEEIDRPLVNWFEECLLQPNEANNFGLEFDYFNFTTQKYLAKSKLLSVYWNNKIDYNHMKMMWEQFQYFVDINRDSQSIA